MMTMVAPEGRALKYVVTSPTTDTATPMPMEIAIVRTNEWESSWAMATGTIMTAETRSTPTTRMATETVRAATTATRTLSVRTGRPHERAKSSSWERAKRGPRRPIPTARIAAAMTAVYRTSSGRTTATDPKR